MDQNSSNGTDKRSWRERLGIGAGKDMPRIADEFTPAAPAPARPAAVKPAPMAPRPQVKAAPPRGTPAAAPVGATGEKLAEKLKAQREAQERLAEQRVQAASQRAVVKPEASNGAKPKFTFAVDDSDQPKPAAPAPRPAQAAVPPAPPVAAPPKSAVPPRSMVPPPSMSPAPMTPPRAPLGAERPMIPPRPAGAMPPPVVPARPQSRYTPPPAGGYGNPPSYGGQMPPPYRPIDPGARGYSAGGYQPPPAYAPPPPVSNYGNQPRLNMPATPPAGPGFSTENFDSRGRSMRPPPRPAVGGFRAEEYPEHDVFSDTRATRRATAGDYTQAYRDEQAYEEDLPPSRGPLLPLVLLFLLALAAGLGLWWVYQSSQDKTLAGGQGNAPVVQAPAQPAKVTPDPAPQANAPPKKLIYDRIVGDREVLGGDVIQSEEVPAQPGDSTNIQQGADPAAGADGGTPGADTTPASGQEELVPLPLPPPPGDTGAGDQQGALPGDKTSNQAMINPAAGASQAADPSLAATGKSDPGGINSAVKSDSVATDSTAGQSVLPVPPEPAPVPGGTETTADTGSETISEPDPAPAVAPVKKKVIEKKPVKTAEKGLGSKPVVLVPPSRKVNSLAEEDVASAETAGGTASMSSNSGGLYDGDAVVAPPAAGTAAAAPVKKKRTIADLFKGEDSADEPVAAPAPIQQQATAPVKITQPTPQPAPQQAPQPAPQQQASAGGSGYVAQLASFANQSDASKEFGRLKAKHGAAFAGLSPIVTQAVVGGSTRYRLAVGVMQSREQASAVCAKLFAAGERDCLVRRQ